MTVPLPGSVFARLAAGSLLAILVSATVAAALIARDRNQLRFWTGESSALIEVVASTSEALADVNGAARRQTRQRLQRNPPDLVDDDAPPGSPHRDSAGANAARAYQRQLAQRLGNRFQVRVLEATQAETEAIRFLRGGPGPMAPEGPPPVPARAPGGDGPPPDRGAARFPGFELELDVFVRLPDGEVIEFRVPEPPPTQPLPYSIFMQLALVALVLVIALFLIARSIARPLEALSRAADAMSRGETPQPLNEQGARELSRASRAFNAMHERLHRYMSSRNRMVMALSHDLRTPLTRLRLRAERVPDPATRERIRSDIDEMAGMIQSTLDLFRDINSEEPPADIDLNQLLRSIVEECRDSGDSAELHGAAAETFRGRPSLLKRAIANLVGNAIKYGARADIYIEDGAALELRIEDRGPGIPESDLEKVFAPFLRLEDSRGMATGGHGLGLSIARDFVEAHGGTLVLKNGAQGGLVATVTLPRAV